MDHDQMLLPTLIDERARTEPGRLYCAIVESLNKSDDVVKINYSDWANAINRCAWWLEKTFGRSEVFKTLAYVGPSDVRYALITLAAGKTGHKAMLLSPANSVVAQVQLLEATQCSNLLIANNCPAFGPAASAILAKKDMQITYVETVEYWLTSTKEVAYPLEDTLDSNPSRPFVVLHTSGSTGLPEPIVYTFAALAVYHRYLAPKKIVQEAPPTIVDIWKNHCLYVAFPPFHMVGLLCMTATGVYWNMPPIIGPPNALSTAELAINVIKMDFCEAAIISPAVLQEIAKHDEQLKELRKLKYVMWCGAPLSSPDIAEKIRSHVDIYSAYGSTEFGVLPLTIESQENHEWMSFNPIIGATFRHYMDDLYELVIVKDQKVQPLQFIFLNRPELSNWPSKDLMSKHPTKDLWRYRGRRDDFIVMSNGLKVNPLAMESIVMNHPKIVSALLVGTGYTKSSWLIEARDPPTNISEKTRLVNDIWPAVEKASQIAPAQARVSKGMVVFTTREKPMFRVAKGSVQRKRTIESYQEELDSIYETSCEI